MPFKSEAQRKFFRVNLPHLVQEWEAHTLKKKLPRKVTKNKKIVKKKEESKITKKRISSKNKKTKK